jgi:hypothetical protein
MKQQIESPHAITVFRMCTELMHQFFEVPMILPDNDA